MSETSSGLINIIEPAAPVLAASSSLLWPVVSILALSIASILLFIFIKYRLPAFLAIKRVRELNKKLLAAEHTPHETVLMLALELRHGLSLKRLRADILPQGCSQQDSVRWTVFMQHLDDLLYQRDVELDAEKMAALFAQTEYWLKHYSRKSQLKKIGL